MIRWLLAAMALAAPLPSAAFEGGLGVGAFTQYVIKDSSVSGPCIQPSLWAYLPALKTQASAYGSIATRSGSIDDAGFGTRTGVAIGTWAWVGLMSHWSWLRTDAGHQGSGEIGAIFTWFTPPYRPTVYLAYDVLQREDALAAIRVPYTIRTGWLPPTTFIPELGVRFDGIRPSPHYLSFSAMLERTVGWLVIVPVGSVVIPRGEKIGNWIVWGGLHLGVRP